MVKPLGRFNTWLKTDMKMDCATAWFCSLVVVDWCKSPQPRVMAAGFRTSDHSDPSD